MKRAIIFAVALLMMCSSVLAQAEVTAQELLGTYWEAEYYYVADQYGTPFVEPMPNDAWAIDLFLNEDGTVRLRDWSPDTNFYHMSADFYQRWAVEDGTLYLYPPEDGFSEISHATFANDGASMMLYLDEYEGMISLVQAEYPLPGGEYLPADLLGDWKTVFCFCDGEAMDEEDMLERGLEEKLYIKMEKDAKDNSFIKVDFLQQAPRDFAWMEYYAICDDWPVGSWWPEVAELEGWNQAWTASLYDWYDAPNNDTYLYLSLADKDRLLMVWVDNSYDEAMLEIHRLERMAEDE